MTNFLNSFNEQVHEKHFFSRSIMISANKVPNLIFLKVKVDLEVPDQTLNYLWMTNPCQLVMEYYTVTSIFISNATVK